MRAGRLRHRITIQRPERVQNSIDEWVDTWVDVATVWGAIEPLTGRTFFEAQQANSDVSGKVTLRYKHLEPTYRLRWTDWEGVTQTYQIVSIIQPQQRSKETQVLYKEALD